MSATTRTSRALIPLLAALLCANALAAQSNPAPPVDPQMAEATRALNACSALAERGQMSEAATQGRRAETLFQAQVANRPRDVEAGVGLARVLTQCILPSADMVSQGELSTRAIELLESALRLDPKHWTARYVLASIYFRSPSFLGRAPLAAAQFDELLRQQGDRTDNPR